MSIPNLKITFHLDGSGVCYDPHEPIHLDSLLAWALAPYHCQGEPPARDEPPIDIPLPLDRWEMESAWGWRASALFPEGETIQTLQYWRKRFRQGRAEHLEGRVNIASGPYRDYNMPLPLLLCREMVAWAVGDRHRVEQVLRKHVRSIGKKRAYGHGQVTGIDVEVVAEDLSLWREGRAQRWLPDPDGLRIVRPRPPYWNLVGALPCCEVGEEGRANSGREGYQGATPHTGDISEGPGGCTGLRFIEPRAN